MARRLSKEEIASRLAGSCYSIISEYRGKKHPCLVRCEKHGVEKEIHISHLLDGRRMACCHEGAGGQRNTRLTDADVVNRLAGTGYVLVGEYRGVQNQSILRCEKHEFEKPTRLSNIFNGGKMACCGKEEMVERLRISMRGEGNHFFGKRHSIETRERLSRHRMANPSPHRPPLAARKAISDRLRGKPRSDTTKAKLRAHMLERGKCFDFVARKAEQGKTAGRQGIFYAIRIAGLIKLGSATTTMGYRLSKYRQKYGANVELLIYCFVDDAGRYEAAMMRAYREHWSHGEYFHDFLLGRGDLMS